MPNTFSYTNKKGVQYFLHSTMVQLKSSDRKQEIFYFKKSVEPGRVLANLPAGYVVVENTRSGLPVLKRVK